MQIGKRLRQLRQRHGLTQAELACRCDLSKGFISQLESDQTSPSIATLEDILAALATGLPEFFAQAQAPRVVFGPEDVYQSSDAQGVATTWLIPHSQRNDMEPILLDLPPGAEREDGPHAGEEFGYVLSGMVHVLLDGHVHKAKKGESFYYSAGTAHGLKNPGKIPARVLWLCTPPNF